MQPEILLMDAWIGAGDAAFLDKVNARLHALLDDAGILVLATHNERLIERICNRVVRLEDGSVSAGRATPDWTAAASATTDGQPAARRRAPPSSPW